MNVISPETRMMGLPYGEEIMIVGRTMWTQSTSVTDRRTDGRTELRSQRPWATFLPCDAERRTLKSQKSTDGNEIISQIKPLNQNKHKHKSRIE